MTISNAIFDLDGTLVQTERLKAQSYAQAAVHLRDDLNEEEVLEAFKDVVGLSRREVATTLLERFDLADAADARRDEFGVDKPWQAYVQIRLAHYERLIGDPETLRNSQWSHNLALLRQARQHCDHVALSTMSQCKTATRVLDILDLGNAFDFVATRDDVENAKPDPEIYLLVAAELGVAPESCFVVEDSPSGVRAALAAGMRCLAVSTPFTRERLHEAHLLDPHWIVDDPQELMARAQELIAD